MDLLSALKSKTQAMVEDLRVLVQAESPSIDLAAVLACADKVSALGERLLGKPPDRILVDGRNHLRWTFGQAPRVLLLAHFDTVWPLGTTARWPFSVDGDKATGPGSFDTKAGVVQGMYAIAELASKDGVDLLLTGDEEVGSLTSKDLIYEVAAEATATLVLEPSHHAALKVARKGSSRLVVDVTGRAAHAGLEPEKGINALVELAHQIIDIERIADPEKGTTVVATLASAGTTNNTVPANARVEVNVRAWTVEELERVGREMSAFTPKLEGTRVEVSGGPDRSPLEESAATALFERAVRIGEELGLGKLESARVGGGSDGNLTASAGVPTLDGLGAVGDGPHSEGEYILVSAMAERAALVARLIEDIRNTPPSMQRS